MFATLIGTNAGRAEHQALFARLYAISTERGFAPPEAAVPVQADGPLEGWTLEQKGPADRKADFFLAVTRSSGAWRFAHLPGLQDHLRAAVRGDRLGLCLRCVAGGSARRLRNQGRRRGGNLLSVIPRLAAETDSMKTEFEHFEEIALSVGRGREVGTTRQVPVFVPEGTHQGPLLNSSITYLTAHRGFVLLDLRGHTPDLAVAGLRLHWPELVDKWPDAEFSIVPPEGQDRLLVAGGLDPNHVFWRMLAGESLLYAGHSLPPSRALSSRCIVVPDSASVVAIVSVDSLAGYRLEHFGAVGRFNTNQVPFHV